MINFDSLLTEGYYLGNINDIIPDMEEFDKKIIDVKKTFEDPGKYYQYRHVIQMHPEYGMWCNVDEIPERRKLVETSNYTIGQQWYDSTVPNEFTEKIKSYFHDILKRFINIPYPELEFTQKTNCWFVDSLTVFANGDFIEPHTDGKNPGRLCVVLIYLSDPADQVDGGGEFVLEDKNLVIKPVKGNFLILDFTKHNLKHTVKMVKNNFLRFTYNCFVYNTDKEIIW